MKLLRSLVLFVALAALGHGQTAQGPAAPGGIAVGNPVQMGVVDITGRIRPLLGQADGVAFVSTEDGSASGSITTQNLNPNSGVATAASTVATGVLHGTSSAAIQVTGTYTGALTPQITIDGANWISAASVLNFNTGAQSATIASGSVGIWMIDITGAQAFRVTATAAVTGTAVVTMRTSATPMALAVDSPLPTGGNTIGAVNLSAGQTLATLTTLTGGGTAEDAATTSSPHIVGGIARTALPAATVIAGDAVRLTSSISGQAIVKPFGPRELDFFVATTVTTATQTAIRAAQAAGIRQNVTAVTYQNTNATATTVTIQDGSTTLVTFSAPASMANPVQLVFPTPLFGTAATALNYTAGTTGANVLLNVTGFNSY